MNKHYALLILLGGIVGWVGWLEWKNSQKSNKSSKKSCPPCKSGVDDGMDIAELDNSHNKKKTTKSKGPSSLKEFFNGHVGVTKEEKAPRASHANTSSSSKKGTKQSKKSASQNPDTVGFLQSTTNKSGKKTVRVMDDPVSPPVTSAPLVPRADPLNKYLVDQMKCSKSCCESQWPVPFMLGKGDPSVVGKGYVPNDMSCGNGEGGTGCPCTTQKVIDFLGSRGGNA
jgi:hypothetical protein